MTSIRSWNYDDRTWTYDDRATEFFREMHNMPLTSVYFVDGEYLIDGRSLLELMYGLELQLYQPRLHDIIEHDNSMVLECGFSGLL